MNRRVVLRCGIACAGFVAFLAGHGLLPSFCLVDALFGVRCPGCGITTSIVAAIQGEWGRSIDTHAGGLFVLGYFGLMGCIAVAAACGANSERCCRVILAADRALLVVLAGAYMLTS